MAVATPVESGGDEEFWAALDGADFTGLAAELDADADELARVLPALSARRKGHVDRTITDGWRYRVDWQPLTATAAPRREDWLVAVPAALDGDERIDVIVDALGADTVRLVVDTPDRDVLHDRITALLESFPRPAGVLSLLALDEEPAADTPSVPAGLATTAALVQALGDAGVDAPLWCVTTGAVRIGPADAAGSLAQAAVWGLGRVAAMEYPGRWGGLVDLPADFDPRALTRLPATLAAAGRRTSSRCAPAARTSAVSCQPRPERRCRTGPPSRRTARSSSPVVPARWAASSRTGSPTKVPGTSCSPAAAASTRRVRGNSPTT